MSGLLNTNLNGATSNIPDSTGRPYTASFSAQAANVPSFHHSGLHNIHGNFNLPNMAGSMTPRNAAMSGIPSSGVQQPGGSISTGRFTSNNLPVAMSQIPHGHTGVANRGGLNIGANPAFSSGSNAIGGSMPGMSNNMGTGGNRSSVPGGMTVNTVLGNMGPRINSSVGNMVGTGSAGMGRTITSGGVNVPGITSRMNLTANAGSGNINVQGSNRLMSGMLPQGGPQLIGMLGSSYGSSGGTLSQNQVQGGNNTLSSVGMLHDVNSSDTSPFDINDFPQLTGRPSSAGGPQGQFGNIRKQGVGVSSIVQQNQEFSIQNEDFPALPGYKAGTSADYSMDLHHKEQLHDNVSMMQAQHYSMPRTSTANFNMGGNYTTTRQQHQQGANAVSNSGISFTAANNQDLIHMHNSDLFSSQHGTYHSQVQSSQNMGLRPLSNPTSSIGSYEQLIQQYQQPQSNQSPFRLQQMSSAMGQSYRDQSLKSIQGPSSPQDPHCLLGLLPLIRGNEPDLATLALGIDLTTLGLNLNSNESLYKNFGSPWSTDTSKGDPEFHIPSCYCAEQPPPLQTIHFSKFQSVTLFYIFYSMPKDEAQLYAANELHACYIAPAKRGDKKGKVQRNNHVENEQPLEASSPSSSGCSFEENLDSVPVEHGSSGGDSSVLNLLDALGSGNPKFAAMYKKRKREQSGLSSSDEEQDDFKSANDSLSEGEYTDEQGNESGPSDPDENYAEEIMENGDHKSIEDYSESYGDGNDKETSSSFNNHLACSLTKEEVDKLKDPKCKFKWEMPENDIPLSKWVGTGEPISKEPGTDMASSLKEKIYKHWMNINKTSAPSDINSSRENFFFSLFSTYRDIMHCNKKPFYMKGGEEDSFIMDAYLLHTLNHVYRTRELVIKNDTKLNKLEGGKEEVLASDAYVDQGFTRPKVLFLLPLRSIALRVVLRLIQLTPLTNKDNVEHLDRFTEEFGAIDDEEKDKKDPSSQGRSKPADFRTLFGGNNNDHFMLGIKFTKRTIKLYSDFYTSDIIVASPLGLVTKIGETEFDKEKDVDYLSSIEVLVIDHADVIVMQNWTHVNTVFDHLNRTPSKQHGTDIMRIRPWYLDGQAQFYRQTILLGSHLNPDINALFNRLCVSYQGKAKLDSEYKGVLPKILLQVQQIYERFNPSSIIDADDARLDYFCKKVFPKIRDSIEGGIMIFISSYFEFVRIRNFLKSQNSSFCLLGEYTKQSDISRARVWFFEGKRKIMLYTERAHFYHRYKIRGIQNLIIYSLPERKEFYPEIINMLDASRNMMCNVLFSPFDLLKLERIVGTAAAKRMLSSDKDMFVFS